MSNDTKKILQEASRWLRVGFLTISVLGPVINTLSSRLRERAEVLREEAARRGSIAYTQSQERLSELKDHPYSQGLLKRGSDLTDDLVDRSSKLSQVVTKRGEQVGRDLAERSGKATQVVVDRSSDVLQELAERSEKAAQELAKRGEQVSKEITKRGAKVSKEVTKRSQKAAKEVTKRSQKAQRELAKRTEQLTQPNSRQNSPFWAVFSFTMGLTAAGVAAYLLIRKRLQQRAQNSQQAHIALNGSLNGTSRSTTSGENHAISRPALTTKVAETPEVITPTLTLVDASTEPVVAEPELEDDEPATEKMPSILIQGNAKAQPAAEETAEHPVVSDTQTEAEIAEQSPPVAPVTNATFLGVVSTKRYYPIETPLNELHTAEDGTLDVIYFATEDEAKTQGYTVTE